MAADDTWLEIAVEADAEAVEPVSELFARYAYNAAVAVEEPFRQDEDGDNFELDIDRPAIVRAYLRPGSDATSIVEHLEKALWHLGQMRRVGPLVVAERHESDWANAWKEHFHVHRVGRRIVIRPTWRPYERQPDDVVIDLDPGMAFGTGLHPSTQLTLAALEDEVTPGARVLDVGVGSGILSIAALKLGAGALVACDTDSVAVTAARANLAANGLTGRAVLFTGTLGGEVAGELGQFDVIAANIIARVIAGMASDLAGHLAPTGVLITSGIIVDRRDDVVAALTAAGLSLALEERSGDWVTQRWRR